MTQLIEHSGIIKDIQDNQIQVLITRNSACNERDVKSACTVSDQQEKIIDIECSDLSYVIGEEVLLIGRQSIGHYAVLFAFVLPVILVLITLIILHLFLINETISGIGALLVLVPYYTILSLFNKRMKTNFKFGIRKVVTDK
jgi:positive regulator of sigma E activity